MEFYLTLALSTAHLTPEDCKVLDYKAGRGEMVTKRQYGYFVKLYEKPGAKEACLNDDPDYSDDLSEILAWAAAHDFRMIEFDRDVEVAPMFKTHNW